MKDNDVFKDAEPLLKVFLKDLRNQIHLADLKQETIAEMMQTTPGHISERLNSKLDMRLSWLLSFCIKFKIKPSSVFNMEKLDREFENLLKKAD